MAEASDLYPPSPRDLLKDEYVGKDLTDPDVAGPQAVVDVAVVRRNCSVMLEAVEKLGVSFRAHVKTHKTVEVTRLQVGDAPRPVRLIVSTVAEAENLLPFLVECKESEREVNVIYGVPPSPSSVRRLRRLQEALGAESFSYLIDHESQVGAVAKIAGDLAGPVPVFIKVDTGYSRAGVTPESERLSALVKIISESNITRLRGFYCHHGSSYGVSSSDGALNDLAHELDTVKRAAATARAMETSKSRFVLSVGATPTATAAQNLLNSASHPVRLAMAEVQAHDELELHAGVYPFLDLQQLATHARPRMSSDSPTMDTPDIGLRILAEVRSVYEERSKPEALIGAGLLALGREPCKSYPGWGIVASNLSKSSTRVVPYDETTRTGWIVGRISQEHGILTWEGDGESQEVQTLEYGDKLMLWPNHACISAAGFGWYLVIDSDMEQPDHGHGERTRIVDVWPRWRGW